MLPEIVSALTLLLSAAHGWVLIPTVGPNEGTLIVNTLPPSSCTIDGKARASTPFAVALRAGYYVVACETWIGGAFLKKYSSAAVTAGKTQRIFLTL